MNENINSQILDQILKISAKKLDIEIEKTLNYEKNNIIQITTFESDCTITLPLIKEVLQVTEELFPENLDKLKKIINNRDSTVYSIIHHIPDFESFEYYLIDKNKYKN